MPNDPNKPKATRKGFRILHVAGKWWQYKASGHVVAYSIEAKPIKLLAPWHVVEADNAGDGDGQTPQLVSNWIWREMNNP